jgi:3-oxoacyl-[acyl-carrier protein] reductase
VARDNAEIAQALAGHVALVTGGNHGIGAATAVALAGAGAQVLVSYLRLEDPPDRPMPQAYGRARQSDAAAVVEAIRRAGGSVEALEADLSDPSTPGHLFDMAQEHLGPVDILINNASGWVPDTFGPAGPDRMGRQLLRVSPATIDQVFSVDARGAALLIAEFAKRHIAQRATWGRIVGLTSGDATGFPEEVSYGAAKAALENYTMSAAAELARYGITANIVHPPVTDTGWITPEVRAFVEDGGLRVVSPEAVAEVILFLASDAARLVTGSVLRLR